MDLRRLKEFLRLLRGTLSAFAVLIYSVLGILKAFAQILGFLKENKTRIPLLLLFLRGGQGRGEGQK